MLLGAFTLAMLLSGFAVVTWLWERETSAGRVLAPKSLLDTGTLTLLAAMTLATALNWGLSAFGALAVVPLMAASCAGGGTAFAFLVRRKDRGARADPPPGPASRPRIVIAAAVVVALLPLVGWIGFVTWRGYIMPPLNHDALAYHLPKAVFYARHGGFYHLDAPDWRIAALPSNYELLLTDVIVLTHADTVTEWLGALSLLAYLGASLALVERWWGRGLHMVPACLILAGMPLTLLHSGADKNDLLVAALAVFLFHWSARWAALGESVAAIFTIVSAAMLVGVKPSGLFFACAVVPPVLLGARRRRQLSNASHPVLSALLIGVLALSLLGAASYVDNALPHPSEFPRPAVNGSASYGQWANLWMAPLLIFRAPFSDRTLEVWVPWRHEYWFWPRYELFFSHWGSLISVTILTLPLAIVIMRRRRADAAAPIASTFEVSAAAVGAFLGAVLLLPLGFAPLGIMLATDARYLLFVPSFLVAATVPALWKSLIHFTRAETAAMFVVFVASSGWFCRAALDFGAHDRFVPISKLAAAASVPRSRSIPFEYRATEFADIVALPDDVIAVDAGFGTWLQPLFGINLTRPIVFVRALNGRVDVPDAARWVVVDRCWDALWNNPRFENMGQWRQFLVERTSMSDEGTEVYRLLLRDPRFRVVYDERSCHQAVFERRSPRN